MPNQIYKVGVRRGKSCACCGTVLVSIESSSIEQAVWTGPETPVDQIRDEITGQHQTRKCVFCLSLRTDNE